MADVAITKLVNLLEKLWTCGVVDEDFGSHFSGEKKGDLKILSV